MIRDRLPAANREHIDRARDNSALRSIRTLLLSTVVAAAGCAGVQLPPTAEMHPGQKLFNGHVKEDVDCYKCHDGDAGGTLRGPSLKGVAAMSDEEILEYIDEGESIMPAFKDKLADGEKRLIVEWLRVRFPPQQADP